MHGVTVFIRAPDVVDPADFERIEPSEPTEHMRMLAWSLGGDEWVLHRVEHEGDDPSATIWWNNQNLPATARYAYTNADGDTLGSGATVEAALAASVLGIIEGLKAENTSRYEELEAVRKALGILDRFRSGELVW